MCARFTLTLPDYAELARALGISISPGEAYAAAYRPRYNAAPGETHLVLRIRGGSRELVPARWGLVPRWAKDASGASRAINARIETARTLPTFRDAFASKRCVLPADGFYEWGGPKSARQPFWFHAPDGGLLYFAGLYDTWRDPASGAPERTFTILTTPANETVAAVHDRMPALLDRGAVDAWLGASGEEGVELIRPAPIGVLVARRVSPRVGSVKHDDPTCVEEEADGVRVGQTLSLFKLG